MFDLKTNTIAQFVAEYFTGDAEGIDYATLGGGQWSWIDYVNCVAAAGSLLDDVVQSRLRAGGTIAEWYEVLEEASGAFRLQLLSCRGQPDPAALAAAFGRAVDSHLES
jgi:hypothetical protein